MLNYLFILDLSKKQAKRPQDYIFVKDPRKLKSEGSSVYEDTIHMVNIDNEEEFSPPLRIKEKSDDMNIIKAYIGNLLYEKWFIDNFTKNTDHLDSLPASKLSKFSKLDIYNLENPFNNSQPLDYETNTVFGSEDQNTAIDHYRLSISSDPNANPYFSSVSYYSINFIKGLSEPRVKGNIHTNNFGQLKSPKERDLWSKKNYFRSTFIKNVENPIQSMETKMR